MPNVGSVILWAPQRDANASVIPSLPAQAGEAVPSGAETQQSKRDSSVATLPQNDGIRSDNLGYIK
jgi:hypothetical protein